MEERRKEELERQHSNMKRLAGLAYAREDIVKPETNRGAIILLHLVRKLVLCRT